MTYPRRLLFGRSEAEGIRRCGLWYFQEGGGENLWHFDAHGIDPAPRIPERWEREVLQRGFGARTNTALSTGV